MFHPLHILSACALCVSSAMAAGPACPAGTAGTAMEAPETPEKAGAPAGVVAPARDAVSAAVLDATLDARPAGAEAAGGPASAKLDAGADAAALDLLWPVETRSISSAWGPRVRMMTMVVKTPTGSKRVSRPYTGAHKGIDLTAPLGHGVYAALDGRVCDAGRSRSLGNFVKIAHGNGVETVYGHNSANLVRVGDVVLRGQIIARVGNTGHSTGPHVHFEVRIDGRQVNPMPMLNDTEMVSAEMTEHNEAFLRRGRASG